ncbi:hypothetical protein M3685_21895 [Heyndrickxia oleronia]|uniref:hypothetical protein n=1 Tax=Heyndrickxia oleronia TaxID=38875 RepID=UPI00203BF46E|nr:hypothetical protein [Heyndrickxia oleronia]MCM3456556.1 hypothetical protein [Heyndrickxia oleronia]
MQSVLDYDSIHNAIKNNVGLDAPFYKLKYVYANAEWQQVKPNADLINDYHKIVDSYCATGNLINDTVCFTDYSFWTVMKTFKPTEDLYQFIDYIAQSLKTSVFKEFADFQLNWDTFLNFINMIGGLIT